MIVALLGRVNSDGGTEWDSAPMETLSTRVSPYPNREFLLMQCYLNDTFYRAENLVDRKPSPASCCKTSGAHLNCRLYQPGRHKSVKQVGLRIGEIKRDD